MNGNTRSRDRSSSPVARLRRRARWLMGATTILLLLIVLIWCLPGLLANSSMRDGMLRDALTGFEGEVTIHDVSLGWLSPVKASGISAVDGNGDPLAEVQAIRTERSLLGLLLNRSQPGTIHLDQPTVHVVVRNQGSNWEDSLAGMLEEPSEESPLEKISLQVHGGTLKARNDDRGRAWQIENVDAELRYSIPESSFTALKLTGQLQANGQAPGTVAVNLDGRPDAVDGSGEIEIHIVSLPMGTFQAAARRLGHEIQIDGRLNVDATILWSEGGRRSTLQLNRLNVQSLALASEEFFGPDQLKADFVTSQGTVDWEKGAWTTDQFDVETDFAKCQFRGGIPAGLLSASGFWERGMAELQEHDIQFYGQLDLASLAAMLPHTLHIRPTTTVQTGEAKLVVSTQAEAERRFNAKIELLGMSGDNAGKSFQLSQPLRLNADFHSTDQGLVVDAVTCRQSNALNLSGQGTLTSGKATARGQLTELAAEWGQFLDLSGITLEGDLSADLHWNTDQQQQLSAVGRADLRDFCLATAKGGDWREQELTITTNATAALSGGALAEIRSATLTVDSEEDRLSAELLRPVASPLNQAVFPVHARAVGKMNTWKSRLQPFLLLAGVDLGELQASGLLDADATGSLSRRAIAAEDVTVRVNGLNLDTDDLLQIRRSPDAEKEAVGSEGMPLHLHEEQLTLTTRGLWDSGEQRLTTDSSNLTCSTIGLQVAQFAVQFSEKAPIVNGKIDYRVDLGKLRRAMTANPGQGGEYWNGSLTGQVIANHQAETTNLEINAEAKDLIYYVAKPAAAGQPAGWHEVWREPTTKITGKQSYDHRTDRLTIEQLAIASGTAQIEASGVIDSAWDAPVARVTGAANYDLQRISQKMKRYWGDHLQLIGSQQGRFELTGPLRPAAGDQQRPTPLVSPLLAGNLLFGWQTASIDGLVVGPAELKSTLAAGVLRVDPLDVPVSGGRLTTAPRFELNAQPAALVLDRGPVLQNVQISPQMCDRWIKYIAPMVADATRAQGVFSLSLDEVRMPLASPNTSRAAGNLQIQAAQVGPGPLAQRYIGLALQIRSIIKGQPISGGNALNQPWLTLPQQDVAFEVRDGRVWHRQLAVSVQDVEIYTTGSVGFDESLDLVAEVPIRDDWVAGRQLLSSLRGTRIRIPLRGTFSRPDVDSRAIEQLGRQFLEGAAVNFLEDNLNLNDTLQGLFGPRR